MIVMYEYVIYVYIAKAYFKPIKYGMKPLLLRLAEIIRRTYGEKNEIRETSTTDRLNSFWGVCRTEKFDCNASDIIQNTF